MTVCQTPGCQQHYGCRLRAKGLQVSPRVTVTRSQNWRKPTVEPPAYNKTIIHDTRPDGSQMPILKANGDPLRQKEYDQKRADITSRLRAVRTGRL